jgi:S-adenosylhomocysteine hydrolase
VNSLLTRIHKYAEKRGLTKYEDNISIFNVVGCSLDEVLEVAKEVDAEIIFLDGLKATPKTASQSESIIELYKQIVGVEEETKKGFMVTAQRNQQHKINGVRVIDYINA